MDRELSKIRVVGAAIVQGGACLVAQRSATMSEPLKWEFPGGKPEPGEDPRAALAREIREELAVEVTVGEWLGRGTSVVAGRRIELDVYLAGLVEGEVELAEHADYGWFTAGEIASLDWAAADVPVLGALEKALRASAFFCGTFSRLRR